MLQHGEPADGSGIAWGEQTVKRRFGKNKKGMSLVELIAVMAISVVVVGAAMTALYGSSRSTSDGAADYGNHSDAQLLEAWLRNNIPTAQHITPGTGVPRGVAGYTLFFPSGADGYFEIAKNGVPVLQVGGVRSFAVSTANVGQHQTFSYRITAAGSGRTFVLSGGIVLNNIANAPSAAGLLIPSELTYTNTKTGAGYLAVS